MAEGVIKKPSQSAKIYRFVLAAGAVSANTSPAISQSYAADNQFYVESGKIKTRYSGTVQISTHIIGATGNTGRLWAEVVGGNLRQNLLNYGEYASADNVQIAQVDPSTSIYVNFFESFTLGAGNTKDSLIFITIL